MAIKKSKKGKTHTPKTYIFAMSNGTAIYGDRKSIATQWQELTAHPDNHLPIA
jgi:hypothetical protein